jgi:hypothetical protein
VQISDIENIHANVPPLEFKRLLTSAARAITSEFKDQNVFLSYRGDGVFVGVVPRNGVQTLKRIGDELWLDLLAIDSELPPEVPDEISLVFGDPVVAKIFTRPGTARNLRAAIDNAQRKLWLLQNKYYLSIPGDRPLDHDDMDGSEQAKWEEIKQELREEYEQLFRQAIERKDMTRFPKVSDKAGKLGTNTHS